MTPEVFPVGELVHGIPYSVYHDAEGLRSGYLQTLRKGSPAHLKYEIDNPRKATPALIRGQLIHRFLENPEAFMSVAAVMPEFTGFTKEGKESKQSKEAKDKRDEWLSKQAEGAEIIDGEDHAMLTGIHAALKAHPLVRNLVQGGIVESSLRVRDPETGLILKGRFDVIARKGYLIDYKSTLDASKRSFISDIFRDYGYFYILQAAHYVHALKLAGAARNDAATFVAVEHQAPFGINTFPLDEAMLSIGENYRARLTRQYAECLASGRWPLESEQYPANAVEVYIPEYVKYQEGF